MHPSAKRNAEKFVNKYLCPVDNLTILEVGSRDVNGSLRDLFNNPSWSYTGLDKVEGHNVDIVNEDGCYFSIPSDRFNVVVSTSCLEHDPIFWVTFSEMVRVLSPGGLVYLCVPSGGGYHAYPRDCWRFQLDAYRALEQWVPGVKLLESFIDPSDERWQDNIGIFRKES